MKIKIDELAMAPDGMIGQVTRIDIAKNQAWITPNGHNAYGFTLTDLKPVMKQEQKKYILDLVERGADHPMGFKQAEYQNLIDYVQNELM